MLLKGFSVLSLAQMLVLFEVGCGRSCAELGKRLQKQFGRGRHAVHRVFVPPLQRQCLYPLGFRGSGGLHFLPRE